VQAMMNMTLFFMAGVTAGLQPLTVAATRPAYATLG
jgi:hypothetical protein